MNTVPCVSSGFTTIVFDCRSEPRPAHGKRLAERTQAKAAQTATFFGGETASPARKRMDHMASPARVNQTASAAPQLHTAAAAPLRPTNNASTSSDDDDSDDYPGICVQRPLRSKSGGSIYDCHDPSGDSDAAADLAFLSQAMSQMSQAVSKAQEAPLHVAQEHLMQPGNDGSHLTCCPLCGRHVHTHFIQTHCNECMRQTQPDDDDGGGGGDAAGGNGNGDTDAGSEDFDVGADTLFDSDSQDEADEDESDGSDGVEVTEGSDEGDEDGGDGAEVNENAAEDRLAAAELHVANEAFVDDDGAYDSDESYAGDDSGSSDDDGAYDSDESYASDDCSSSSGGGGGGGGGGNDDVKHSGDGADSSADSSDDFQ